MNDLTVFPLVVAAGLGLVVGVLIMLLLNKYRSGNAMPNKIKQEMDEYQTQVEQHFEQTSEKFKQLSTQYQDLYKHLSEGADSLCRVDSQVNLLADKSSKTAKQEKTSPKGTTPKSTASKDGASKK